MAKGKESKPHIGIFGRRNHGKSSLINAIAQQEIAIVSDHAGTTTDPVKKSMEITGIGAVVLVDTAGIDDEGELGGKRIKKSMAAIKTIDLAILVVAENTLDEVEENLIKEFQAFAIPFFIVHNKKDLQPLSPANRSLWQKKYQTAVIDYSALSGVVPEDIVALIREKMPENAYSKKTLLGDLLSYGDLVLMITPIDIEAPEGRMILPQVQAIRDILDNDAVVVVAKEREVDMLMQRLQPRPALVITDSQVFLKADAAIPPDIPLTSFSIMLARHKGDFQHYLEGTPHLSELKDDDRVLILESCTHHVSCDDIGRVKIPRWLNNFSGKKLHYEVVSGLNDLPRDIRKYSMVIQCGGCVITQKQIISRLKPAVDAGIPVTNYGMAIAYMHGIYERAVAPFVKLENNAIDYL
ncbi:MAG: [FeFe] hydrogenase H-cluster maturation GTPase HydF [Bacteroidales bacterium]|nr:[FeFe] hydrogenase H-cluster maturation GTPase HydF [Bacteroidales bacterium]